MLYIASFVFQQGTSDFCVSPDKFIVNQTKDFLSAGRLSLLWCDALQCTLEGLFWDRLVLLSSIFKCIFVSCLLHLFPLHIRCGALLFVLQPQPAKPLSTGTSVSLKSKLLYFKAWISVASFMQKTSVSQGEYPESRFRALLSRLLTRLTSHSAIHSIGNGWGLTRTYLGCTLPLLMKLQPNY